MGIILNGIKSLFNAVKASRTARSQAKETKSNAASNGTKTSEQSTLNKSNGQDTYTKSTRPNPQKTQKSSTEKKSAKEQYKDDLKSKGVKVSDDEKKFSINVQAWENTEPHKEGMKVNNCLIRIASNYKPENMSIKDAMEKIMSANENIYGEEANRPKVGGNSKYDKVIYTGEEIQLPADWFEIPEEEKEPEFDAEAVADKIHEALNGTHENKGEDVLSEVKSEEELKKVYNQAQNEKSPDKDEALKYLGINGEYELTNEELAKVTEAYNKKYGENSLQDDVKYLFSFSDEKQILGKLEAAEATVEYNSTKEAEDSEKQRANLIDKYAVELHESMYRVGTDEKALLKVMQLDPAIVHEVLLRYSELFHEKLDVKEKMDKELSGGYQDKIDALWAQQEEYEKGIN